MAFAPPWRRLLEREREAFSFPGPWVRGTSYSSVKINRPYVALTFDDGPHATNTPRLLDILRSRTVKATFYVVGTNAKRYPHILQRMVAEGHEIGNHTVTHGNLTKMSPTQIRNELRTSHYTIVAATGVAPRTMRPPYGAITANQKSWIRQEFGYPSILWNVGPERLEKARILCRREPPRQWRSSRRDLTGARHSLCFDRRNAAGD